MDRGLKGKENRGENAGSKVQSPSGGRGGSPLKTTRIKKKINFLLICYFLQERFPECSLMFNRGSPPLTGIHKEMF